MIQHSINSNSFYNNMSQISLQPTSHHQDSKTPISTLLNYKQKQIVDKLNPLGTEYSLEDPLKVRMKQVHDQQSSFHTPEIYLKKVKDHMQDRLAKLTQEKQYLPNDEIIKELIQDSERKGGHKRSASNNFSNFLSPKSMNLISRNFESQLQLPEIGSPIHKQSFAKKNDILPIDKQRVFHETSRNAKFQFVTHTSTFGLNKEKQISGNIQNINNAKNTHSVSSLFKTNIKPQQTNFQSPIKSDNLTDSTAAIPTTQAYYLSPSRSHMKNQQSFSSVQSFQQFQNNQNNRSLMGLENSNTSPLLIAELNNSYHTINQANQANANNSSSQLIINFDEYTNHKKSIYYSNKHPHESSQTLPIITQVDGSQVNSEQNYNKNHKQYQQNNSNSVLMSNSLLKSKLMQSQNSQSSSLLIGNQLNINNNKSLGLNQNTMNKALDQWESDKKQRNDYNIQIKFNNTLRNIQLHKEFKKNIGSSLIFQQ
eukprot:403346788